VLPATSSTGRALRSTEERTVDVVALGSIAGGQERAGFVEFLHRGKPLADALFDERVTRVDRRGLHCGDRAVSRVTSALDFRFGSPVLFDKSGQLRDQLGQQRHAGLQGVDRGRADLS
jgi:hypothetical protein